jgi:hypothetical protein
MGKARSVADFTAECIAFNLAVADAVNGGEARFHTPEEEQAARAKYSDRSALQEGIKSSAKTLIEAIDSKGEESLAREVMAPWGEPTTVGRLVHASASHVIYHDGQLNYIQTLFGDDKNHWGGE